MNTKWLILSAMAFSIMATSAYLLFGPENGTVQSAQAIAAVTSSETLASSSGTGTLQRTDAPLPEALAAYNPLATETIPAPVTDTYVRADDIIPILQHIVTLLGARINATAPNNGVDRDFVNKQTDAIYDSIHDSIGDTNDDLTTLTTTVNDFSEDISSLSDLSFAQGGNAFGASASLGTTDSHSLSLITSGTERLRILENGKVGIGMTDPAAALAVEGVPAEGGSNLIVNGSFDEDGDGWEMPNAGVSCAEWDGDTVSVIVTSDCNDPTVVGRFESESGKTYQLTFTVSNAQGGDLYLEFLQTGASYDQGPFTDGTYTVTFTTDYTGTETFDFYFDEGYVEDASFTLDNVSLLADDEEESLQWVPACTGWEDGALTLMYLACSEVDQPSVSTTFESVADETYTLTFTLSDVTNDQVYFYFDQNGESYDEGPFEEGTHSVTFTTDYTGTETVNLELWDWNYGASFTLDDVSITAGTPDPIFIAQDSGGSEVFHIAGNGRVGIGTDSPTELLTVAGSASFNGYTYFNDGVEISGDAHVDGTVYANCFTTDGGSTCVGDGDAPPWTQSGSTVYYNDGGVGIGTTNPGSYKLYVQGDTYTSGTSYSSALNVTGQTYLSGPLSLSGDAGSAGEVLISNGPFSAPAWVAASSLSGGDGGLDLEGTYDFPDSAANHLDISGDYAYVADGGSGLQIIDISDPSSPTLVGMYDTSIQAQDVIVSGGYAYVADGGSGLKIIDISDPSSPTLAGVYDTPSGAWGIDLSGTYAYVADDDAGLQIIDISDPSNPTFVASYDTPGFARGVTISGTHAYIGDLLSVQILDVSDPSAPTFVGTYSTPGSATYVSVVNDTAYVAYGTVGLKILDVSDPSNPSPVGTLNTPGDASSVTVAGNRAYVADGDSGLQIIDISDPSSPTTVNSYDTPNIARDVVVSGVHMFVLDGFLTPSSLQILIDGVATPSISTGSIAADILNVSDVITTNELSVTTGLNVGSTGIYSQGTIAAYASSTPAGIFMGDVGIGTTTPTAQLSTTGTVRFAGFGAGSLQTDALGNVTVSSDERLKDLHDPFTRSIEDLLKIDPVTYTWKPETGYDTETLYTGFSAQNVQAAIPEAVATDTRGYLTLADRPILAAVVNAIKEIYTRMEAYFTKNDREIEELKERIRVLEIQENIQLPTEDPAPEPVVGEPVVEESETEDPSVEPEEGSEGSEVAAPTEEVEDPATETVETSDTATDPQPAPEEEALEPESPEEPAAEPAA